MRPVITKIENKIRSQNRIYFHYQKDGATSGVGLTPESIVEDWEALDTHPRARKLMFKRKPFVVVANDEPYFLQVYSLIRDHEIAKGTWTEEDERLFQETLPASTGETTGGWLVRKP